jgi:SnoaL-like domain
MSDAQRHAIEWECAQNIVRFYNRLDGVRGEEAAALFAVDGKWYREGDESAYTGRAEIAHHVNTLPTRGESAFAPELKQVFHLVNNVEVTVLDAETAEVRALTAIVSGGRPAAGEVGMAKGVSSILRTLEVHKKTSEGWKIATKRTQRELRIG